jgi:hypothetical protein
MSNENKPFISISEFGIWARLGNQMFQYAYLRTLSLDKNLRIHLPINKPGHGYRIPHFFEAFDTSQIDVSNNMITFQHKIIEEGLYDKKLDSSNIFIPENTNILFEGYFQSEKYFLKYANVIRNDFTFKENIRVNGDHFMKQLDTTQPIVALHVRRTDNLGPNSPSILINDTFRTNAIRYLCEKIERFHILIFSDDKQWCLDNLNYENDRISQTIVDNLSDIEELYVMTLCDHFIIGSSTYSWWGAWLSTNANKIVILPDTWFIGLQHTPLSEIEKDLIPSKWIRLSSREDLFPNSLIKNNLTIQTRY